MIQKNPFLYFFLILLTGLQAHRAFAEAPADLARKADTWFEEKNFTAALEAYESVYAQGAYSEQMLYRLAFMHENMEHYPQAVYYLKKIGQEYGGRDLDAHIRKLMHLNGNDQYVTEDGWNAWIHFYARFSWVIFIVFVCSLVFLLLWLLRPRLLDRRVPMLARGVLAGLFLLSSVMLLIEYQARPERAVVVVPTSYYQQPGFSAVSNPTAIGLGETVQVTAAQDIWVCVNTGGKDWWVPRKVVRAL